MHIELPEPQPRRGSSTSRKAYASYVLAAREQALHDRRTVHRGDLVHQSNPGSHDASIKYIKRLCDAGTKLSVGSTGHRDDSVLAETISSLYKAEVIGRHGPCHGFGVVGSAAFKRDDCFNHCRLL